MKFATLFHRPYDGSADLDLTGFGTTGASFVVPDYLTRVQGLRSLQIGDALNWVALPQFVLVPLVALLLKRIDARLLLVFGATMIAIGSWIQTGLNHDWVGGDFMVSQLIEAVGLAFAITSVIAFAVANITPTRAAAITTLIQIARWLGSEIGGAAIQTFVRVREQVYSNLIGLHVVTGLPATEQTTAQLAGPFGSRATGLGDPAAQGTAVLRQHCAPRGLCAGLYRRVLVDRLGVGAQYSACAAIAPATAESANSFHAFRKGHFRRQVKTEETA